VTYFRRFGTLGNVPDTLEDQLMKATSDVPLPGSSFPIPVALPQSPLDALIEEQGVAKSATFENLLGKGRELWANDEEFDSFLERLDAVRNEKD
jgi:hypothetical protein